MSEEKDTQAVNYQDLGVMNDWYYGDPDRYKQCKAAEGSFIDWSSPRGET